MQKVNYQNLMDEKLKETAALKIKPKLLLHACCAPCSTYSLLCLKDYFNLTVLFENSNIYSLNEYELRLGELKRLIKIYNTEFFEEPIKLIVPEYKKNFSLKLDSFLPQPEGKDRCKFCITERLESAAKLCKKGGFDYFATTLTISPHKSASAINKIGKFLSDKYNVSYLFSDFKKKDGYKKSIELCKKYNIYRQTFCGCYPSMGLI